MTGSRSSRGGVSILVLVDVALERCTPPKTRGGRVSILVLVDVALEQNSGDHCLICEFSFNPCSRGCCS